MLSNGSREGGGRNGRKIFVWSGGKPRRKRWIGMMDGKKRAEAGEGKTKKRVGTESDASRFALFSNRSRL